MVISWITLDLDVAIMRFFSRSETIRDIQIFGNSIETSSTVTLNSKQNECLEEKLKQLF